MTDYAGFHLGALASPLTQSTANSPLQDADPALYWFTQWTMGVIQTHCGSRWNEEMILLGQPTLVGKIVQSTVPYDPVPLFQDAQWKLPLLAIYRVGSDFNDASVNWIRRIGTWHLEYILPPLTPAQLERVWPITASIEAAVYDRVNQDYDPAVLSGQTLKSLMGSEYIKLLEAKPSRDWLQTNARKASGTSNPMLFPLLHMRFEVAERKMPDTYEAWTGVDGNVSVANAGYPPVDIADFSKNNP